MRDRSVIRLDALTDYLHSCGGRDTLVCTDDQGQPDVREARRLAQTLRAHYADFLDNEVTIEQERHCVVLALIEQSARV